MDHRLIDTDKLRKEMREQDKKKYQDPDFDASLPRVWVLYLWEDSEVIGFDEQLLPVLAEPRWIIAGFARVSKLKLPDLDKIRKRCRVPSEAIVKLFDLYHAARLGPPTSPPSQYNPLVERYWLAPELRGRT